MEFKVGMKVVCVESSYPRVESGEPSSLKCPKKDDVLTVRSICPMGGLRFEEIVNPPLSYLNGFLEASFRPHKFVPLLSDFKRMTFKEVAELVEIGEN